MNYNPPPVAVQFSALAEVEGAQFDKAYREILRVPSMSAGLVATTVTPGSTALLGSRAEPAIAH